MRRNWVHPQINAIEYVMWSLKYHIKILRALLLPQLYISCLRVFRLDINFSEKLNAPKSYDLAYQIVKYYRIGIFALVFPNNYNNTSDTHVIFYQGVSEFFINIYLHILLPVQCL